MIWIRKKRNKGFETLIITRRLNTQTRTCHLHVSVNEDEATAREVAQVIRQVDEGGVVERGVGILSDI